MNCPHMTDSVCSICAELAELRKLKQIGRDMRREQKRYFKTRDISALQLSKQLEASFDEALRGDRRLF